VANRLASETSPYLQQHADNPVDWHPWGPEALERARREDRPILLSIGYAACHWCHVMAHESFENEQTAALMNELFVPIKVDREERPDLDSIYMQAVQAMTGHGGWPMTVFLTPDGTPFYGGTYYPPEDRHGLPSFRRVLRSVSAAWRDRRESVDQTARQLRDLFAAPPAAASGKVDAQTLELAYRGLVRAFDARYAGFGGAPKFPPSMSLDFLVRYWARTGASPALDMAAQTFRAMSRGGLYDQIGGGIHRYSVDERWLVPHFEKMLYDNALFARLGVHLWQATADPAIRRATEGTIDWVLGEMRSPEGGFYSSLDADSEGEEGRFYVWDASEFDVLPPAQRDVVRLYWGVTSEGNFEGRNILHVPHEATAVSARTGLDSATLADVVERARAELLAIRSRRVRPGRDEKILGAWNGLMVRALAEAARVFDRADYRDAALAAGEFLVTRLLVGGRIQRTFRDGIVKGPGFLEDQSACALAFLDLYALTYDRTWFSRAVALADIVVDWYLDRDSGFLYDTPRDHETLITRPRDVADNATPSGPSLAAELLLRTAELSGEERYRDLASSALNQGAAIMEKYPNAIGHLLGVADMAVFGAVEIALVGQGGDAGFQELVRCVAARYLPSLVLAGGDAGSHEDPIALMRDRHPIGGRPTAFVCRFFVCGAPTTDSLVLAEQLAKVARITSARG
jgi:uncharacterized protein YyaL (SSP411 family)